MCHLTWRPRSLPMFPLVDGPLWGNTFPMTSSSTFRHQLPKVASFSGCQTKVLPNTFHLRIFTLTCQQLIISCALPLSFPVFSISNTPTKYFFIFPASLLPESNDYFYFNLYPYLRYTCRYGSHSNMSKPRHT